MKALRFHQFGGPENLVLEDVERPTPTADEVLVRVEACGLNFADTERRRGLYLADQPLPETLGFEGAGVVEGTNQRVAFIAPRAHAEFCVVPKDKLIPIPDQLDFVTAAAFPVQWLTAWHVLHTVARVKAGERVLIHSAAGGVGQALTQLAREAGAHVIASVSRDAKKAMVQGAHEVFTRGGPDGPTSNTVDVVLEGIGADVLQHTLEVLAPFGRWVNFGTASGELAALKAESLFPKSLTFASYWLRSPHPRDAWQRGITEVLERITSKKVKLEIQRGQLAEAARWHRRLEGGLTTGKVVLTF
ncbi:MAG: zinc-binding dehydrogenase [Archangium sp.]